MQSIVERLRMPLVQVVVLGSLWASLAGALIALMFTLSLVAALVATGVDLVLWGAIRMARRLREHTVATSGMLTPVATFDFVDGDASFLPAGDCDGSLRWERRRLALVDGAGSPVLSIAAGAISALRDRLWPPAGRTGRFVGRLLPLGSPCFAPLVRVVVGSARHVDYRLELDGTRVRLTVLGASTRAGVERDVTAWRLTEWEPLDFVSLAAQAAARVLDAVRKRLSPRRAAVEAPATMCAVQVLGLLAGGAIWLWHDLRAPMGLVLLCLTWGVAYNAARDARRKSERAERDARGFLLAWTAVGLVALGLVAACLATGAPSATAMRLDAIATLLVAVTVAGVCALRARERWALLGTAVRLRAKAWTAASKRGLRPRPGPDVHRLPGGDLVVDLTVGRFDAEAVRLLRAGDVPEASIEVTTAA